MAVCRQTPHVVPHDVAGETEAGAGQNSDQHQHIILGKQVLGHPARGLSDLTGALQRIRLAYMGENEDATQVSITVRALVVGGRLHPIRPQVSYCFLDSLQWDQACWALRGA